MAAMKSNVSGLFGSPLRNLVAVIAFMLAIIVASTIASFRLP